MIVALIVVCEIGFWLLLAAGLSLRYLAHMPKAGVAVLMCEPVLELVLLIATAIDLRNGAEADWKHGLAAVYVGFSVSYGRYLILWADGHFAHRFNGAPPPVKPPRYGSARAVHEWKIAARSLLGIAIAVGLLQCAVWYVGDDGDVSALYGWQSKLALGAVIAVAIAASYTFWPKAEPEPAKGRNQDEHTAVPPER